MVSSAAPLSTLDAPPAAPVPRSVAPVTIEDLVKHHGAFVWRSILRLGVPQADVDDVTQLVFLRAKDRLPEIPPGAAKGFLFRLALGLASNHKRSRRRRRETSLDDEEARAAIDRAATESPHTRLEQRALLERLLDPLPLELRSVLVLFEGEEQTVPEIADLLGLPPGTVSSRLRRAREEVKAALHRERSRPPKLGGQP